MSDSVHKTGTQPSEWAQTKLAEWERNMAKVKEEHPEFNIDPENKWWIPLVELEERTVRVFLILSSPILLHLQRIPNE
jgi:hypothetical protein